MTDRIVLIDGHALLYRAYHALPPTMATSQGELVNATFGFTSMMLDALRAFHPAYIAVAFDKGGSFRDDLLETYKANRPPMPDELRQQEARVREVVEALNIPIFTVPGYEADDVIGTLGRRAVQKGIETYIVTGDTDTLQLVSADGVSVVLPGVQNRFSDFRIYDVPKTVERYGFPPPLVADYKALVGDKSDNIPGVKGIGEKTATALLQQFGPLDEWHDHLDEITPPRIRDLITANYEAALKSKVLTTIVTNIDIDLDLEKCRTHEYDREQVVNLFRELEFRTLLTKLPEHVSAQKTMNHDDHTHAVNIVTTEEGLRALAARLQEAGTFAFDTETTSVHPVTGSLVGISLAVDGKESWYIPVGHYLAEEQVTVPQVKEHLGPIFADPEITKVAHNAKFDILAFDRAGLELHGLIFDTMLAAYLLGETSVGLKELAFTRLGMEMTHITDLIGTGRNQVTMAQVPVEQAAPYACADAYATNALVAPLRDDLQKRENLHLLDELELPLVPILAEMERTGITMDADYLRDLSRQIDERMQALAADIYELAKHEFNINSTAQLGVVLFEEMGLPHGKKTKTGYSTASEVLEPLQWENPIVKDILEYRQLAKLKGTYVDALPLVVNPETGRVHTSFNQAVAATGRLASSDPNLQNIPVRTDIGRAVRHAFVPGNTPETTLFDGEPAVLLACDYSQIELRIFAHVSRDEALLEAFREGRDIHAATAAEMFGVPYEAVDPDTRRLAKTVNFGIIYGISAFGLANNAGISFERAREFIDIYFKRFPGVRRLLDQIKEQAIEQGYVSTLLGRRRYFPEIQSRNPNIRQAAERAAINAPIQGTAADIVKRAMIRVDDALKESGLRGKMLLQVHDELVLEVPADELERTCDLVTEAMTGAFELIVPLEVEAKAGQNWDELKPIGQAKREAEKRTVVAVPTQARLL
jgi:DNA polymerase-1